MDYQALTTGTAVAGLFFQTASEQSGSYVRQLTS
jgi:hypothetical protein